MSTGERMMGENERKGTVKGKRKGTGMGYPIYGVVWLCRGCGSYQKERGVCPKCGAMIPVDAHCERLALPVRRE